MSSNKNHNDFEQFFELSKDLLCIAGTDGFFKKINHAFVELLNFSKEELFSKQFVEFVHPDDVEGTLKQVERLSQGKAVVDFENRYRCKDGQYRAISWSAQPTADKKRLFAIGRDVTNERNAQRELNQLISALKETTIYAKTDKKGVILDVNHRLTEVSGYSREELVGETHALLNSGVHDKAFFKDMWQTISSGNVWSGMIENKAKGGHHYFVNSIIVPIKNFAGKIENYIAFRFDVTDYIEAKDELQKTLKILNETSSVAKVGGWELDIATGDLFWTDETFRILEVKKQDNQRPTLPEGLDLFTDAAKPIIDEAVQRCIEYGEPYFLELEALTAKGNPLWVYTNGAPNFVDGKVVSLSGTIQNIDDRKKAEIALEKSESRYRGIVENTEDLIAITDADGKILFTNSMANTLLGLTPDETNGLSVYRIFHKDDREAFSASLSNAIKAKAPSRQLQCRLVGAKGNVRVVSWNLQIIYNDDQTPFQIIGIGRDVTDQQKLQQDLKNALEKAQNADRAKTDFLANMSHEIRTPMNGILMSLNLTQKSDDPAKVAKLLNTANASTTSLLQVINDILDFSKLESGKVTIENGAFDPKELLDHITELMTLVAEDKGLSLSTTLSDALHQTIVGDKIRLTQVITNFVSNAIKFSKTGTIKINATMVEGDNPRFRVDVTDCGPGLSQAQQKQLFKRFSQLAQDRKQATSGTGLGLAISKQLIDLMEGQIGVTSDGKFGCTFWFEVPLVLAADQTTQSNNDDNISQLDQQLHILLVEDVDFNRELVTMLLEMQGHKVTSAVNGYLALDILLNQKATFDLILMDNHMPMMTGIQATSTLRASRNQNNNIPIIALTADVLAERKEELFAAGVNGFIAKPVNDADLKNEINRVMSSGPVSVTKSDDNDSLYSLIYISRRLSDDLNIIELLKKARTLNDNNNITGVLWEVGDFFVQTLEGKRSKVYETMARICQSDLHTDIQIVFAENIAARKFAQWSMAFPDNALDIHDLLTRRFGQADDLYAINREQLSRYIFDSAQHTEFYEEGE